MGASTLVLWNHPQTYLPASSALIPNPNRLLSISHHNSKLLDVSGAGSIWLVHVAEAVDWEACGRPGGATMVLIWFGWIQDGFCKYFAERWIQRTLKYGLKEMLLFSCTIDRERMIFIRLLARLFTPKLGSSTGLEFVCLCKCSHHAACATRCDACQLHGTGLSSIVCSPHVIHIQMLVAMLQACIFFALRRLFLWLTYTWNMLWFSAHFEP